MRSMDKEEKYECYLKLTSFEFLSRGKKILVEN